VRPPRALLVPYRHGYPLGAPSDPPLQTTVLEAALAMLENPGLEAPALVEFEPPDPSGQ
jgi:hypothetical protein